MRVGVDPGELQSVAALALSRAGGAWRGEATVGDTPVFAIDPYGAVDIRIAFRRPASGEERYRIVATEVLSLADQRDGRVARIVVIPVTRR